MIPSLPLRVLTRRRRGLRSDKLARFMDKATFNKQYDRAVKAGVLAQASEPRAVAADYDKANDRLIVKLRNGVVFIVPCSLIQGLNGAEPEKIAAVRVMPRARRCTGTSWMCR